MNNKNSNTIYEELVKTVVEHQKQIIGPIALMQAKTVAGIKFNGNNIVFTSKDPKEALGLLVKSYADLFGKASIELSKEAVYNMNPPKNLLPKVLL